MFDVPFCHFREQLFPLHIVHVLHYQTVVSLRRVPNDIQQPNNVGASSKITENLGLALDLSCSDWLQNLDHTRFIVFHIQSPENLNPNSNVVSSHFRDGRVIFTYIRVLATTDPASNFVSLRLAPFDVEGLYTSN